MDFIKKYRKVIGILLAFILLFISITFKSLSIYAISIILLIVYIYFTKSALKNVGDCIYYLVFIAPLVGVIISQILITHGIVANNSLNEMVLATLGYLLVWILVVWFGEIKVVKMATLILAQVATAIYLVASFAINLIPVADFNSYFSSIEGYELMKSIYGHDGRKFTELAIQLVTYPVIVSALLTYLIAEYRDIKQNGGFKSQ